MKFACAKTQFLCPVDLDNFSWSVCGSTRVPASIIYNNNTIHEIKLDHARIDFRPILPSASIHSDTWMVKRLTTKIGLGGVLDYGEYILGGLNFEVLAQNLIFL